MQISSLVRQSAYALSRCRQRFCEKNKIAWNANESGSKHEKTWKTHWGVFSPARIAMKRLSDCLFPNERWATVGSRTTTPPQVGGSIFGFLRQNKALERWQPGPLWGLTIYQRVGRQNSRLTNPETSPMDHMAILAPRWTSKQVRDPKKVAHGSQVSWPPACLRGTKMQPDTKIVNFCASHSTSTKPISQRCTNDGLRGAQ